MGRRRILIVEDTLLIVALIEEVCAMLDFEVVGPVGTLSDALQLAHEASFDLAVLDINLHDELVFPAADVLVARAIPFFFSTGYGVTGIVPERFAGFDLLPKPYEIDALIATMEKTAAQIGDASVGACAGCS